MASRCHLLLQLFLGPGPLKVLVFALVVGEVDSLLLPVVLLPVILAVTLEGGQLAVAVGVELVQQGWT